MQQMPFVDGRPGATTEPSDSGSAKNTSQLPPDVKMTRLAEFFRCLEYGPGVCPWDAAALADRVRSGEATAAEAQAAAFVLEVQNAGCSFDWTTLRFSMTRSSPKTFARDRRSTRRTVRVCTS